MDAAVPMMVEVEAVFDELQAILARECSEENRVVKEKERRLWTRLCKGTLLVS
jgi:hypothetical protein